MALVSIFIAVVPSHDVQRMVVRSRQAAAYARQFMRKHVCDDGATIDAYVVSILSSLLRFHVVSCCCLIIFHVAFVFVDFDSDPTQSLCIGVCFAIECFRN